MINLLSELKGAKSVAIAGHIRPDGDCVGSSMALYLYIKKNMPECDTHIYLETPSDIFKCIKDIDAIESAEGVEREFDAFVVVDCSKDRTGAAEHLYDMAKKTINIDHHITNKGNSDVNYIVPEASSASELVYDTLDSDKIDVDIAKALYIGIIHDTGVLQYSSVSPKTMMVVSNLIGFGFDFPSIIEETFYEKNEAQTRIMGEVLRNCELKSNGRISVGCVSLKKAEEFGTHNKDYDGIVNRLKYMKGVDVGIFIYEMPDNMCKVSLRSGDKIDVSKVSFAFGGGGHKKAAGVTMEGSIEEIIEKLIVEIEKQYD